MTNMDSRDSNSESGTPAYFFEKQDEALLLLSLQEFDAQLPTEEAAREDVKIRLEKENLLFCHDCNSHNLEKKYGARVLKCLDCGSKTWVTAGTFFHHAKRLKPRLAALWLMERGFIVSSSKLHKLANVAQSSAFNILKRVAIVIEAHMERNICEIPSAVFSKVISKRSRETPARAHPLAEQEELDVLEQEKEKEEQQQEQELQKHLQKDLSEKHQEEANASATAPLQEQSSDLSILALNITDSPDRTGLTGDMTDLVEDSTGLAGDVAGLIGDITDLPDSTTLAWGMTDLTEHPTGLAQDITDLAEDIGSLSQNATRSTQDSTYNQLSQQEKILYDLLSEHPVSFEELYVRSNMSVGDATAYLVMLEIAGLASCLPGNNYIRSASNKNSRDSIKNKGGNEALAEFESIALVIEGFVRSTFHGVSRKYLQNYLATYWYYADKSFWQLDSLFSACFRFRPVKLTEIISYVTSSTIKHCEA